MSAKSPLLNGNVGFSGNVSAHSGVRLHLPVMRERTLLFVVVAGFLCLVFGAYLFLPDNTMRNLDRQLQRGGGAMLLPEASGSGVAGGHHDNHIDPHQIQDKKRLFGKIEEERARREYFGRLRKRLELAKDQFVNIRSQIERDKKQFQKIAATFGNADKGEMKGLSFAGSANSLFLSTI